MNRKLSFGLLSLVIFLASFRGIFASEPSGQVIGFYSKGKLSGATALQDQNLPMLHLFKNRNRGFGSQGMTEILENLSLEIKSHYPDSERLQIGDIAAQDGGTITRHVSHQNGLDADVVYLRTNKNEQDPKFVDGFTEKFVIGQKTTSNFDIERNWFALKTVVSTGRVVRIFVDPALKKSLCEYAKRLPDSSGVTETLRRLIPYAAHDDHFHMRITCPAQSPKCTPQAEPPAGDGCATISAIRSFLVDPIDNQGC